MIWLLMVSLEMLMMLMDSKLLSSEWTNSSHDGTGFLKCNEIYDCDDPGDCTLLLCCTNFDMTVGYVGRLLDRFGGILTIVGILTGGAILFLCRFLGNLVDLLSAGC